MQQFYREIGVVDAHSYSNNILLEQLDKTFIRVLLPIDSIVILSRDMNYVEGVKLLDYNEFVMSDHHCYLLDMSIEDYFI